MGRTDVARLRESIGFVDARVGDRFAPLLTVREVIRTGATATIGYFEERLSRARPRPRRRPPRDVRARPIGERRFGDCSQGERKRALIARALVARPRLLLLDEPGAGLDLPGREILIGSLDRLAADQPSLAVVITTHHLEELPASTTHALLLRDGRRDRHRPGRRDAHRRAAQRLPRHPGRRLRAPAPLGATASPS